MKLMIFIGLLKNLQEKAASAHLLASSTVRWVMGPSGTIVTFPHEMGLPKIFDPKPPIR